MTNSEKLQVIRSIIKPIDLSELAYCMCCEEVVATISGCGNDDGFELCPLCDGRIMEQSDRLGDILYEDGYEWNEATLHAYYEFLNYKLKSI